MADADCSRACLCCGSTLPNRPGRLRPRAGQVYCSRECGDKHARSGLPSPIVVATYHRACIHCGARFHAARDGVRLHCSDACSKQAHSEKYKTNHAPRACKRCGVEFTPRNRRSRPSLYCGSECRRQAYADHEKGDRRVAKARRRARMRGAQHEAIDPIKVFERDKWRCHMCHKLTLKDKRGTCHERAPELDHVVTLADGGSHTWGNVACACRKCNGAKGARSLGQLGLGIAA